MSQSKQAAKSVIIIIIFSFGGKILGFIREMLTEAKFGSGTETDTYFVALSSMVLFTGLITKIINTTMISEYSGAAEPPVRYSGSRSSGLTEPPVCCYCA